jgi:hypothetical protein
MIREIIMDKIDYKKELKHLYIPSAQDFSMVEVPTMQFLMIDGQGNPNTSQDYIDAIQALYGVAYTLKFASKKNPGKDYTVPPLEGLWWADDMDAFTTGNKDAWKWTAMIMQPEWITSEMLNDAKAAVAKKELLAIDKLRLETYDEGLSVQIMYFGSYADEGPVIARMHKEWMPANGYTENGKHHEIYIGDPRKVEPAKLKTVIRQPIRKK